MSNNYVAVVIESDRFYGVGYEVANKLCKTFSGDVYLTGRDESRGLAAVKNLKDMGFKNPKFHLLDITVPESVRKLRDYILKKYGGLDALYYNTAIAFNNKADVYFTFRDTCNILFPILKPHATVEYASRSPADLSLIPGQYLRDTLAAPAELTEEKLSELVSSFVKAAENGTHVEEGWPANKSYAIVSKVALSTLCEIQQNEFLDQSSDITVEWTVYPGNVGHE